MQDDKKFVEGGEDEGMGKADIRYGDTTVFVQHIKVRKHDIEYLKLIATLWFGCVSCRAATGFRTKLSRARSEE